MNSEKELKYLKTVQKLQNLEKPPIYCRKSFLIIAWLFMVFLLITGKRIFEAGHINIIILFGFYIFIGSIMGIAILSKKSYDSWPFLKPHVNTNSIKERINEIKA